MGSYYWQQVIIYQKVTHCWVTAKRKKSRERGRAVKTIIIQTNTIKRTAWGHLWFQTAYGITFIFIFSMQCPLACWARGLKMLRTQIQDFMVFMGSARPLHKLGTTAGAEGRRQESRRAQLHEVLEGFDCFFFFHCPANPLEMLKNISEINLKQRWTAYWHFRPGQDSVKPAIPSF